MDVAGFVGFAARGPMDIPVLVEDPVAFRDVFGPDLELATTDDGTAGPGSPRPRRGRVLRQRWPPGVGGAGCGHRRRGRGD